MKLSLSILNADLTNLKEEIKLYDKHLDYYHLDVMDGNFVPNISFGPDYIKSLKAHTNVVFDTHLMINNPEFYVKKFIEAGSDIVTFHFEATNNPEALIDKIHALGAKAGISIKPMTKVEVLEPLLKKLDLVLIMTVEPGFGGQSFMEDQVSKLEYLKKYKENNDLSYLISVDGGINNETINKVNQYTDLVVVGSYITKAKNVLENIKIIKER